MEEIEFDLEHDRQLFAWASRRVQNRFQPNTWQAFWLTAVKEIKGASVAKELGMTVAQVYVARSRVMKRLRQSVQRRIESGSLDLDAIRTETAR